MLEDLTPSGLVCGHQLLGGTCCFSLPTVEGPHPKGRHNIFLRIDGKYPPNNMFNPLNAELNPICHLLAILGAHHILQVSGGRVKNLKTKPCLGFLPCEPPASQLHARTEFMIHFPLSARSYFFLSTPIPSTRFFLLISASSTVISHIIGIKLRPYFSVFLLLCLCRSEFEIYWLCRSTLPSFPSQSISILPCCIATLLEQKFILALIRHHAIKMLHAFLTL